MKTVWRLQDAKNRFSELVEHALHDGPQTITRRGTETVVLVSVDAFRQLSGGEGDLVGFMHRSPLADVPLDLTRRHDDGREVEV